MQLDLSGHHVEITDSMRGYVERKFERISGISSTSSTFTAS